MSALMSLLCSRCSATRERKVHKSGRLEGPGAFTQGWGFCRHSDLGRLCPSCLEEVQAACDSCSRRNSSVAQTGGDPSYRRRRYSRAEVTP